VKSLNSYLLAASAVLFSGVVVFGAIAVISVHSVGEKARMIEAEARNIGFIGELQDQIFRLLLVTQQYSADPQQDLRDQATPILASIRRDISAHSLEVEAVGYPETSQELRLLSDLDAVLLKVFQTSFDAERTLPAAVPPAGPARDLFHHDEQITRLLREINGLHFAVINRKIGAAETHFNFLSFLFITLSIIGLFIVWLGYTLHSRYVVSPVKALTRTARLLAAGDLSARAATQSKTEIGILYRSFNDMAETIQRHEHDLSELTHELERRVENRTRSLEQAYASLQRTQQDLVRMERLATLGQIATTVNHEVKTPLNALYINLQLLKRKAREYMPADPDVHSEIGDLISVIDREVLRISSYLDEFVHYARFPASRPRSADANRIVREVIDMFSQKAEEADVRLRVKLNVHLPPLLLDERKVAQALINLYANAFDAMPQGGTLSVATREEDQCGLIEVSDTGTGISSADQERIFTPFFTRKENGLGFGLAIVQRIAEDHGGSVSCVSQPGQGSTFTLRLPISGPVASKDAAPNPSALECSAS
jgi:two-component system, NtrC family, sensor kinase